MNKFARLLKSPLVRQAISWGVPILVGWLFSQMDKAAEKNKNGSKKK